MWLKAFVNKETPLKGNPLKLSCSHFLLHWTIHAAMVLLSTDIQTLWSYHGDKYNRGKPDWLGPLLEVFRGALGHTCKPASLQGVVLNTETHERIVPKCPG